MLNLLLTSVRDSDSDAGSEDAAGGPSQSDVLSGADLLDEDVPTDAGDDVYLFPEERVLVLLDEYDGRMWQGDVVSETGLSKATISRLLTDMEEAGDVERYWKNGKKVVTLPGLGPASST